MTERVGNEGQDQKRGNNWGLFHLFVLICAALIIALWGVIIRGGEPPPPKTAYVVERPVVLLFLVDTAVKRYAHYESGRYLSPFFHGYHLPSDTRRQGVAARMGSTSAHRSSQTLSQRSLLCPRGHWGSSSQYHRHGLEVIPLDLQIGHLTIALGGGNPIMTQQILDGLNLCLGV
jgi:hypothetical protein